MALHQFAGLVREFDQSVIRTCTNGVFGSCSSNSDLAPILSKIRQGIPAVESAESFQQRMVAERIKRNFNVQQTKLNELEEKISQAGRRKSKMIGTIQSIRTRVDEHHRILSESDAIRENFAKQIDMMQSTIDSLTKRKEEVSQNIIVWSESTCPILTR
jgi:chromosome segregation ATPase